MSCCGGRKNNQKMTHPIISGLMMGGAIYGLDMMLRPQFAFNAAMEVVLFLIEGAACDIVYTMTTRTGRGFGSFGDAFESISLMKSLLAGGTLWLTDILLRMNNFGGTGTEMLKFFIQGFIVYLVLGVNMGS